MLVTTPQCRAQSTQERRWEKADLIVEGKITGTTTENGVQISSLTVDRVLKTGTITNDHYSKGLIQSIMLQIPANSLAQNQDHRFFLEETQGTYRLIAAEKIEAPEKQLMNTGSYGFLMLIMIALVASQRPLLMPDKGD